MRHRRTLGIGSLLASLLLGFSGVALAVDSDTALVGVDTTSIRGTSGNRDLILDAAASSRLAYASSTRFRTDGTLATSALDDVSGNTLLSTDTTDGGSVSVINRNSDGGTTPLVSRATPRGAPVETIVPANATPESSSLIPLVCVLPAPWLFRRRWLGR